MHNIHELEKQWRNYKIRKYLPHVGAAITTVLLLIYIFNTITIPKIREEQSIIKEKKIEHLVIQEKEPKKELITIEKEIVNKSNDKTLTLNPSLDFMKNLRTNSITTYKAKDEKIKLLQNKAQKITSIEKNIKIKNVKKQEEEIEIKEKKATIFLVKQETIDDINHVIKRFEKNNNPALSLFVAKKYYKLKDYHKAYNYSLLTNGINKDIDESWILFSKSLVKLGKKNMAIKTLTKYIEQSDSLNAKILRDNIKSGKFK